MSRKKIILIACLCALIAGIVLIPRIITFLTIEPPGTSLTEASFATDEDRRVFIDDCTPFPIPSDISNIRMKYDSWLDWTLDARFTLPADQTEAFLTSLRQHDPAGITTFSFQTENSQGTVTITGQTVKINCSNPPPKT
ncbi:MAG: hypothetical protein JW709_07240 [Sedimentisphaerales bacterium]|nr:hypothetical protein [Sedimentisphaerales bacterium]